MQFVMLPTTERNSLRFEHLCEHMDACTADQQLYVFGCLAAWYCRWASDQTVDHGIFFDCTARRLGMWSGHKDARRFGNGLIKSGYVHKVEDVFPPELTKHRIGFVVMGALETTWERVHRHRSNATQLCIFLTDPVRRIKIAPRYGWKPEQLPTGWLDPVAYGETSADPPTATQGTSERSDFVIPPSSPRGAHTPYVYVKEKNNESYNVNVKKSGKPKTDIMLAAVRHHRYEDPYKALLAIDDTETARQTWADICEHDAGAASAILANMTETDDTWASIRKPAAVAMRECREHLRTLGITYGRFGRTVRPPRSATGGTRG